MTISCVADLTLLCRPFGYDTVDQLLFAVDSSCQCRLLMVEVQQRPGETA